MTLNCVPHQVLPWRPDPTGKYLETIVEQGRRDVKVAEELRDLLRDAPSMSAAALAKAALRLQAQVSSPVLELRVRRVVDLSSELRTTGNLLEYHQHAIRRLQDGRHQHAIRRPHEGLHQHAIRRLHEGRAQRLQQLRSEYRRAQARRRQAGLQNLRRISEGLHAETRRLQETLHTLQREATQSSVGHLDAQGLAVFIMKLEAEGALLNAEETKSAVSGTMEALETARRLRAQRQQADEIAAALIELDREGESLAAEQRRIEGLQTWGDARNGHRDSAHSTLFSEAEISEAEISEAEISEAEISEPEEIEETEETVETLSQLHHEIALTEQERLVVVAQLHQLGSAPPEHRIEAAGRIEIEIEIAPGRIGRIGRKITRDEIEHALELDLRARRASSSAVSGAGEGGVEGDGRGTPGANQEAQQAASLGGVSAVSSVSGFGLQPRWPRDDLDLLVLERSPPTLSTALGRSHSFSGRISRVLTNSTNSSSGMLLEAPAAATSSATVSSSAAAADASAAAPSVSSDMGGATSWRMNFDEMKQARTALRLRGLQREHVLLQEAIELLRIRKQAYLDLQLLVTVRATLERRRAELEGALREMRSRDELAPKEREEMEAHFCGLFISSGCRGLRQCAPLDDF